MNNSTCSWSPLDFSQTCIRESWATIVPLAYVVACLIALGLRQVSPSFMALFTQWLSVEEALESISGNMKGDSIPETEPPTKVTPIWIGISLAETSVWATVAAYNLYSRDDYAMRFLAFAATWLYATVKTAHNMEFPSMQLMVLFALHFIGAVFLTVGDIYFSMVYGHTVPATLELIAHALNVTATATLIISSLASPFNPLPVVSAVSGSDKIPSPEDSTTVWGWITFRWVNKLISEGSKRTLNEVDIYELSLTTRAWPLFSRFSKLDPSSSLLWRLFRANSLDIMYVSIFSFPLTSTLR